MCVFACVCMCACTHTLAKWCANCVPTSNNLCCQFAMLYFGYLFPQCCVRLRHAAKGEKNLRDTIMVLTPCSKLCRRGRIRWWGVLYVKFEVCYIYVKFDVLYVCIYVHVYVYVYVYEYVDAYSRCAKCKSNSMVGCTAYLHREWTRWYGVVHVCGIWS